MTTPSISIAKPAKVTPGRVQYVQTRKSVSASTATTANPGWDYTVKYTKGENLPNYWHLKNQGRLIPHTSFTQTSSIQGLTPSNYYEKRADGRIAYIYPYCAATEDYDMFNSGVYHAVDSAYAQAMVQRAAANIANKGWDGLTFASELPKLKQMFAKTAKRMGRLHRDYREGKTLQRLKRSGKDIHHDLNSLWLEGRYGWRTLAYDVRDLSEAITEFDAKRKIWTERSGYGYTDNDSNSGTYEWASSFMHWSDSIVTDHSIRGAVGAEFTPSRVTLDPVTTAWERVPYSFIVDWVINVGDTLAATKLQLLSNAITASWGVKSVTTRTIRFYAEAKAGCIVTYDNTYTTVNELVKRVPTSISMRPSIKGTMIDPSYLLDLKALIRGGKPGSQRR